MTTSDPTSAPASALPVNDLAAAYQPRRVWASIVSIAWNLLIAASFLASGGAWRLHLRLSGYARAHGLPPHASTFPAYLIVCFFAYAALNYPLELYFGYLEERQFVLAKDGIRAWTRDWLVGTAQHALLFLTGSGLLLALQVALPSAWLPAFAIVTLALFLLTSYLAADLLPHGLFHFEPVDDATRRRLVSLVEPPLRANDLPPMIAYSAPHLRDFTGGLVGLGNRQVMLLSRSTLAAASDNLLRFVLLHDLGHRRYHHLLLSTLAGWAWVAIGLVASDRVILRIAPGAIGLPPYVPWLALCLSLWMALGEPLLAWLGRRLEYQADRFYLRHGGTVEQMRAALEELSHRNLARTEGLRRRHTIFHPLPSVWNRLHAAGEYAGRQ